MGVAEGVTAGEAEATGDQSQRVGAITTTICELGAALTTAGVDTVTDGATSSRAHGSLGLAQSTEEPCQFTGLLGKSALAATGVCAGTGIGVSHEGDHGQGNSGSERVHGGVA